MTTTRRAAIAAALLLGAVAPPLATRLHHPPAAAPARARGPATGLPMSLAGLDRYAAEPQEASRSRLRPLPPPAVAAALAPVTKAVTRAVAVTKRPVTAVTSALGGAWACLRQRESGGDYANKRNPVYRGAFQFDRQTWASVGGHGDPADAPPAEQDMRAAILQASRGWAPWPVTSRACGLR